MDAAGWDRRYADRALVWSVAPNRFVAEQVGELPPGRALDLAAGEGRNAIWLAEQGWRVTAIDFSSVAIDKARRLAGGRAVEVDWVVADLLDYPPPTAGFDLVLLCYLHLPRPEHARVLAAARDAVAPGGTLLFVGHDRSNIAGGHGGPQDPEVLSTPGEVAAALAGFSIELAEVVERPVSLDPGHGGVADAIALDNLVRARRC